MSMTTHTDGRDVIHTEYKLDYHGKWVFNENALVTIAHVDRPLGYFSFVIHRWEIIYSCFQPIHLLAVNYVYLI